MAFTRDLRASSVLLLLLLAPSLSAQDTPAALMLELEQAMPRKAPAPGMQVPYAHTIDWEQTLDTLGGILARAEGSTVEPYALYAMGSALFSAGRIEEARALFEHLKERFADHPLVKLRLDPETKPLVDQALDDCADELAFRAKHDVKTLPRPVLDQKLLVTLHFTEGAVKIRFYENAAPEHRKNFLKLAREGFYDRTRVHRLVPGMLIQLGDPNTREDNPAEWGKGDPGYALDAEFSLATHKKGTLTAVRGPGRSKSHGSQFQILVQDQPHLDAFQTPFAEVVEGLEIVDRISRMTRTQIDAPAADVFLNGITIQEKN